MGDLPLALEQAAAVMAERKISYVEYLRRFEHEWGEMLGEASPPSNYSNTISLTWGLSFAAVEAVSSAAANLLNLSAFLNAGAISAKLLRDGHAGLPTALQGMAVNPTSLDRAILTLRSVSLAEPADGGGVSLHPLVATVTRDRLDPEQAEVWASAAVSFVAANFHFESSDVGSWVRCADWLPHVLAAADHAERLGVCSDLVARLLNDAGRYLMKKGRLNEARSALDRSMALYDARVAARALTNAPAGATDTPMMEVPVRDVRVSAVANNLGRLFNETGDLAAARQQFERALAIDEAVYGHAHPHVAEVINNYGICLQKQGETDLARRQFAWAAEAYEAYHGPQHPKLASLLNNLGYVLKSAGDLDAAELHLQRALGIAENTVGAEHPTTASVRYNLADCSRRRGDILGAREQLEQALAVDEAVLGQSHPRVRRDCEALAELLESNQDPAAAEYRRRAHAFEAEAPNARADAMMTFA